jgi:hypothetical protein
VTATERAEALDCLLDHPGTETARTHANTFGGTIDQRANGLKIRPKDTVGLIVGMADIMPGLMPLVTDLTYIGHDLDSFSCVVLKTRAMLP